MPPCRLPPPREWPLSPRSGWPRAGRSIPRLSRPSRPSRKPADVKAVHAALRAVSLPWLETWALRLQELVAGGRPVSEPLAIPEAGTCVLFADGMRLDVARELEARIRGNWIQVDFSWRRAALPTVTAMTKPAVSPVAGQLSGGPAAEFHHDQGWKLARRVAEEVRELGARRRALLDAGWREVRMVPDHGWPRMPGDLPKVDLPPVLTVRAGGAPAGGGEDRLAPLDRAASTGRPGPGRR